MPDEQNPLRKAINRIYETQGGEISCQTASVLMARCADSLLTNEATKQQYPELWVHFQFCPDCAAEYDILMDLAQLATSEKASTWVSEKEIPPRPRSGQATFWPRAQKVVREIFPGFPVQLGAALARGDELGFAPVEVILGDNQLLVELDVAVNDADVALRDLFCHLTAYDDELTERLEGSSAWIGHQEGERQTFKEETVNHLGDVSFSRLTPGKPYTLWVQIAGTAFEITDILFP